MADDEQGIKHNVTPGVAKGSGGSVSATVYPVPASGRASAPPPPVRVTPYHDALLADATRQRDAGQQRVAVFLAQIAAEVYIEQAWAVLLARKTGGPVEELLTLIPDSTIRHNKSKRL